MRKLFLLFLAMAIAILIFPVAATSTGGSTNITITTEEFKPLIWMCDSRIVTDNEGQPGRITGGVYYSCNGSLTYPAQRECWTDNTTPTNNCKSNTTADVCCRTNPSLKGCYKIEKEMLERVHNYAFEGEQISWQVLVMDKNKIEEVSEVVGTIGATQGTGNDKEVECKKSSSTALIPSFCNARILEENLTGTFDSKTMSYYDCIFTVETPASMHDEFFITIEAISVDGSSIMDENEYFFLNPAIALSVDGNIEFDDVRPGTDSYSQTLLVENEAEAGSGVILDMFITGTNFYDPTSSGAACPTTNELNLQFFRYFATNGAYSTLNDLQGDNSDFATIRNRDAEGYVNIQNTMEAFSTKMYNESEIIQSPQMFGPGNLYYSGNTLSPGSEMALTFKLSLPEPCVGDFSDGDIFFWGEAI